MATEAAHRSRPPARLALGQVRYQLTLLLRSPLGFFLSIVFPLLLLICLKVITPARPVGGLPYAQWLTPAMCAFCLLNACYVTLITSIVLAREEGVLKRLRGTPLPAWTYLAGRSGSAFVTSVIACAVIIATGVAFFGVSIVWHALGYFAAAACLGVVCFFLLGAAVATAVPKTETALPIAFGTMLPLAFISDVFFSVAHPPAWLHDLASAFPVAPIAQAMEDSFNPATQSWPMPISGLLVVLGWSAAAIVVIALAFRWEPGPAPAARGLGRSRHWLSSR
ncbi:MAG TPA: ABC transporter permease [Streptosporangiaceae bacterium]|nr:ABC transporter permease [Streptosporangiaceae bacterium]